MMNYSGSGGIAIGKINRHLMPDADRDKIDDFYGRHMAVC